MRGRNGVYFHGVHYAHISRTAWWQTHFSKRMSRRTQGRSVDAERTMYSLLRKHFSLLGKYQGGHTTPSQLKVSLAQAGCKARPWDEKPSLLPSPSLHSPAQLTHTGSGALSSSFWQSVPRVWVCSILKYYLPCTEKSGSKIKLSPCPAVQKPQTKLQPGPIQTNEEHKLNLLRQSEFKVTAKGIWG